MRYIYTFSYVHFYTCKVHIRQNMYTYLYTCVFICEYENIYMYLHTTRIDMARKNIVLFLRMQIFFCCYCFYCCWRCLLPTQPPPLTSSKFVSAYICWACLVDVHLVDVHPFVLEHTYVDLFFQLTGVYLFYSFCTSCLSPHRMWMVYGRLDISTLLIQYLTLSIDCWALLIECWALLMTEH